jgi:hypothetical protein
MSTSLSFSMTMLCIFFQVICHGHVMAEFSVARNIKMTNRRVFTLPFLPVLGFLYDENQDEILDTVLVNQVSCVQIIRL